ncbi:UNKNOWN [Stylonychia lemnae]|uniref:C3H1-type domain-containing protein n=1 Tax=Stylonychia lemnae TaxID=5949 RepID=A0A078A6S6_STYLE|nr:UNKNOWN [Stylonychia lemnae]|eukprot:CDW77909.1 UNKNOWN [Stylonychia lemnae]
MSKKLTSEICRFYPNCKNGEKCPYTHPTGTQANQTSSLFGQGSSLFGKNDELDDQFLGNKKEIECTFYKKNLCNKGDACDGDKLQSSSIFGQTQTNLFGSSAINISPFGQPSGFNNSSSTGSIFGQSQSLFGAKPFGQTQQAPAISTPTLFGNQPSVFAGQTSLSQTSTFGTINNTSSIFSVGTKPSFLNTIVKVETIEADDQDQPQANSQQATQGVSEQQEQKQPVNPQQNSALSKEEQRKKALQAALTLKNQQQQQQQQIAQIQQKEQEIQKEVVQESKPQIKDFNASTIIEEHKPVAQLQPQPINVNSMDANQLKQLQQQILQGKQQQKMKGKQLQQKPQQQQQNSQRKVEQINPNTVTPVNQAIQNQQTQPPQQLQPKLLDIQKLQQEKLAKQEQLKKAALEQRNILLAQKQQQEQVEQQKLAEQQRQVELQKQAESKQVTIIRQVIISSNEEQQQQIPSTIFANQVQNHVNQEPKQVEEEKVLAIEKNDTEMKDIDKVDTDNNEVQLGKRKSSERVENNEVEEEQGSRKRFKSDEISASQSEEKEVTAEKADQEMEMKESGTSEQNNVQQLQGQGQVQADNKEEEKMQIEQQSPIKPLIQTNPIAEKSMIQMKPIFGSQTTLQKLSNPENENKDKPLLVQFNDYLKENQSSIKYDRKQFIKSYSIFRKQGIATDNDYEEIDFEALVKEQNKPTITFKDIQKVYSTIIEKQQLPSNDQISEDKQMEESKVEVQEKNNLQTEEAPPQQNVDSIQQEQKRASEEEEKQHQLVPQNPPSLNDQNLTQHQQEQKQESIEKPQQQQQQQAPQQPVAQAKRKVTQEQIMKEIEDFNQLMDKVQKRFNLRLPQLDEEQEREHERYVSFSTRVESLVEFFELQTEKIAERLRLRQNQA